jgi:surface polysaccharide O-acyltransferase-like enzyme
MSSALVTDKDRILYIDILRIISILAVITIHVSSSFFKNINVDWVIANLYDSISRWSVPVMVMVSGLLLLDPQKEYPIKIFFKKRLNKVLIPLIFWGIVYTIWKYQTLIIAGQPLPIILILKSFIDGTIFYHLWFIYMIIGLYISTPILRIFTKNANRNDMKYFLLVWFLSSNIIDLFMKRIHVGSLIDLHLFTGFAGYFILGHYLKDLEYDKKCKISLPHVLFLSGFLITFVCTHIISINKGVFDGIFYNYFAINVMMMSIGVFLLVKEIDWSNTIKNISLKNFILDVGPLAFGIYLIHALILQWLKSLIEIELNPIIDIPITVILVASISYILIKIMKKLPLIEKAVP